MARIEGIIKEQYTAEEIAENIKSLQENGIIESDDHESLVNVAKAFYFRGLVHGHAEESKVESVRVDFDFE